jgi:hypothetical protein
LKVITKLVIDCKPNDGKFLKAKQSLGNIVEGVAPVGTGKKVALTIWTKDLKEQENIIRALRRKLRNKTVTTQTIQYFSG